MSQQTSCMNDNICCMCEGTIQCSMTLFIRVRANALLVGRALCIKIHTSMCAWLFVAPSTEWACLQVYQHKTVQICPCCCQPFVSRAPSLDPALTLTWPHLAEAESPLHSHNLPFHLPILLLHGKPLLTVEVVRVPCNKPQESLQNAVMSFGLNPLKPIIKSHHSLPSTDSPPESHLWQCRRQTRDSGTNLGTDRHCCARSGPSRCGPDSQAAWNIKHRDVSDNWQQWLIHVQLTLLTTLGQFTWQQTGNYADLHDTEGIELLLCLTWKMHMNMVTYTKMNMSLK